MAFDFGNANEAQRSAISTTDGPLLIIAGPGTGKTYTLVKRIVYLIIEKDVLPEEIMIATFTEKAAKELITRITNELYAIGVSVNLNEMYIGTFHSICLRILKDHLEYTRIKKNYRMLDNFDQQYMVFQKINRFRNLPYFDVIFDKKQGAWRQAGEIVKYVNNLAEELVDIDEMQGDADEHIVAVANIMKQYNTLMEDENLIDFSSIQTEAYKLLIEEPSILEEIQQKIKYVMVDEYQDTNYIQELLVFLIAGKNKNICVVGDDDQGLYRFRGATIRNGELIIMTTDHGEEDVLSVVKTVEGNHERDHYSQRQIDVIKNEIIPKYDLNSKETGIITPYRNQVKALEREITDIDAATVHKFQGKEMECIIISTVDDEISDFTDDPYLINVAVSRAKKKLMLVVTGNKQSKERNITDLIDYIEYNNFEVVESKIYSIFDYLYKQYTEARKAYLQKHKKISAYDSENLMYSLIEDILSDSKYSSLDVVCHFPLNMLIKNPEFLSEEECRYAMNPATHLDFLIYNRISKKPVLAIEVDGYEYHKKHTVQASRDLLKNRIMELYEIPLLRFMTNGSGEKEKIIEMLEQRMGQ